jgi:hypothetical protein
MNSWFVWIAFALVAIVLGLIAYFFSLRVLRAAAAIVALATAGYLTWYGLTHPAKPPGSLSGAFTRGADALIRAFFHLRPVTPGSPGPGWIGLLVIAVLLVIGYRELEALSQHCHARSLDTSELTRVRQTDQSGDGKGAPADVQRDAQQTDSSGDSKGALTDVQRHDRLAAELKFWLPAVDVRAPAILPGGSRSSALASIAEASGVNGSGLAGAIIRFFGMLWPSPRRVRVRVWVKGAAVPAKVDAPTGVAVCLDDPVTGESIGTKTLAASSLDNAACVAAGYVARRIFAGDPTAPPWCIGMADGGDLAAMLLARHERVYPENEDEVTNARYTKIGLLEEVAWSSQCAGVARYELAHLYDLTDDHVKALALHATNREQYKRFYRGRYRLAMSLEMVASSDLGEKEPDTFNAVLKILDRWDETPAYKSEKYRIEDDKPVLSASPIPYLLEAAQKELREIGRYLTLKDVIWQSFWHRNERGVLKPYWLLRHRQSFHDGVCLAQLLVAVRQQTLNEKQADPLPHGLARLLPAVRKARKDHPKGPVQQLVAVRQIMKDDPLPRPQKVLRIATAIADDSSCIAKVLGIRYKPGRPWRQGHHPRMVKRLRTRRRPRQYSTTSWPAAYNLACVYAAICAHPQQLEACMRKTGDDRAQNDAEQIKRQLQYLVGKVVTSLEFAINNRECEMERPSEWIDHDPDFDCLRSGDQFSEFRRFLDAQRQRDYPLSGQDFYVKCGEGPHRNWDDEIKYGYVSSGGSKKYASPLNQLFVGCRVFVYISGTGYVGVGTVTETAQPVTEFMVEVNGEPKTLLDVPLRAPSLAEYTQPDNMEYAVRVDWIKTLPREQAIKEKGLLANQDSACKLLSSFTLERLTERFGLES